MNLDKIREEILEIKSNSAVVKNLFSWQGDLNYYKFAYAVYVDSKEKLFIEGYWLNDLEEVQRWRGYKEELKAFLKKHSRPTLTDLLFFNDAYNRCRSYGIETRSIYSRRFKANEVVDNILKDSRGVILWHHQLEHLLRLFYVDSRKVIQIREGLNCKRRDYWKLTEKLHFDNNTSLCDVLNERAILSDRSLTIPPRYKFAYNLFNAL